MIRRIETPRLILREPQAGDCARLAEIFGDPVTMRFWPHPFTPDETAAWIERSRRAFAEHGMGRYVVLERASGRLVGDCGLLRLTIEGNVVNDLGYIFDRAYWGNGYATEAARAVAERALRDIGLGALHANMAFDHVASQRVAERIGMRRTGEFYNARNRGILTYAYTLEREDGG